MTQPSIVQSPSFAWALQAFDSGEVDLEGLLAAAQNERSNGVAPDVLWALAEQHEALRPLPPAARAALHERLQCELTEPPLAEESIPEEPTVDLAVKAAGTLAPPKSEVPDRTGALVAGHYLLMERIGGGPQSRVYKAIDTRRSSGDQNKFVAVKLLTSVATPPYSAQTAWNNRFHQLLRLTDGGILRYREWGTDAGQAFIVTDYAEGSSLFELVQKTMLSRDRALSVIKQTGKALEAAHAASVVHGDLKPGNILVMATGDVKIIDFAMPSVGATPNGATMLAVTPGYASPQVRRGEPPRYSDDVYSLACISNEILIGKRSEGVASIDTPSAVVQFRPDLTAWQYEAVQRGLEPERALRTPNVAQFIAELSYSEKAGTGRRTSEWIFAVLAVLVLCAGLLVSQRWFSRIPASVASKPAIVASRSMAGSLIQDCPECPPMRVLGPGKFLQGDDKSNSRFEKPQHRVAISYAFALASHPVTVEEFGRFAEASGHSMTGCDVYDGVWRRNPAASWRLPGFVQTPQHPVTCVSWNDAIAYAAWLSAKSGHRYRLPSAAEWEFAARAGGTEAVPWYAAAQACANANVADRTASLRYPGWAVFQCEDQYVYTSPVGTYQASRFGLQDMLGNVLTWTADCWHDDYQGAPTDGSPRVETACQEHELRGGSWFSNPAFVRASYRNHFPSDYRASTLGIRLVRELDP